MHRRLRIKTQTDIGVYLVISYLTFLDDVSTRAAGALIPYAEPKDVSRDVKN